MAGPHDPESYEDVAPGDGPFCTRFGSGSFPCGPPYKTHVATHSSGARRTGDVTRRRVVCRVHYEIAVAQVKGGGGGLKSRARVAAMTELASQHRDAFQLLYEQHLTRLLQIEVPALDPALVLPRKDS